MKYKKKIIILVSIITTCILIITAGIFKIVLQMLSVYPTISLSTLTTDQKKTLASLEEIDGHPLYTMRYYGDYSGFEVLKKKYYKQLGLPKPECSTFVSLNKSSDTILGYNSDGKLEPILLLFTKPSDGYASVSVVHIGENFGFSTDKNTPFDSEEKKTLLLYTPFFTNNTGMNEMGFAYAVMAAPGSKAPAADPNKASLNADEARRYLLDHARSVDEAVNILERHNICFTSSANHLLMADASGNSAIIEWVDGKMQVIRNKVSWQVATNFLVYGSQDKISNILDEYRTKGKISNDINGISYFRYATAWDALENAEGCMTSKGAMDILKSISLTKNKDIWFDTQYSIVYDLKKKEIQIALEKKYDEVRKFSIAAN